MNEINRFLDLRSEAKKKSLFLFGLRQTGKTFLLQKQFPDSITYNLLKPDTFFTLSRHPKTLTEELTAQKEGYITPVIIENPETPLFA
jgi:predicted AAA+ superfamily ATPase